MQVEEEREPGSRLVLGDGRDNRDVDLGVARVPEGVEASAPWGNDTRVREAECQEADGGKDDTDRNPEEHVELVLREERAQIRQEGEDLEQSEDTWKQNERKT